MSSMQIAFCLFKYFPFGGLQRDFLRIAQTCQQRGHSVHVYVMHWEGAIPRGFQVHYVHVKAFTNHGRAQAFSQQVNKQLQRSHYDVVVGFNRMPGLDVYFAADMCYQALLEQRNKLWRYLPRPRTYLALEQAVFKHTAKTQILLLTESEQQHFMHYYQTPSERFHLLPPGIDKNRITVYDAQHRAALRNKFGLTPKMKLLLMVGSGFTCKGVDRAMLALAALPDNLRSNTKLWIIGQGKLEPWQALAKRLHITKYVKFWGAQSALAEFYGAADLLLHPSYQETAGMVLLEAMCAGLPVLVTANCGYAWHIEAAAAGCTVPMPYSQERLNQLLQHMITASELPQWRRHALEYTATTDLYSLPIKAAELIESTAQQKQLSHQ